MESIKRKMNGKLKILVEESLNRLYKDDRYLICHTPFNSGEENGNHHVGERAIMFHLAHYMLELMRCDVFFDDYSLDCEYNRNIDDVKRLGLSGNGAYPDIIIHKRGSNNHNWAVFEIKTYWNTDQSHDKEKVEEFVSPKGQYCYKHGVLIRLEKERSKVDVHYTVLEGDDVAWKTLGEGK